MAVRNIDTLALADITSMTAAAGGTTTNGIRVTWDNAKVTRHDIAVTLENIAAAILIEEQITL